MAAGSHPCRARMRVCPCIPASNNAGVPRNIPAPGFAQQNPPKGRSADRLESQPDSPTSSRGNFRRPPFCRSRLSRARARKRWFCPVQSSRHDVHPSSSGLPVAKPPSYRKADDPDVGSRRRTQEDSGSQQDRPPPSPRPIQRFRFAIGRPYARPRSTRSVSSCAVLGNARREWVDAGMPPAPAMGAGGGSGRGCSFRRAIGRNAAIREEAGASRRMFDHRPATLPAPSGMQAKLTASARLKIDLESCRERSPRPIPLAAR